MPTYPDTVIDQPHFPDIAIDYAASNGQGGKAVFAEVLFGRDKPMGMTVILVPKPQNDSKGGYIRTLAGCGSWVSPLEGRGRSRQAS